jgi:hypothetical protein
VEAHGHTEADNQIHHGEDDEILPVEQSAPCPCAGGDGKRGGDERHESRGGSVERGVLRVSNVARRR